MKSKGHERYIGRPVEVSNGYANEPTVGILLGYRYFQRHGRNSPVEPAPEGGNHSPGFAVAIPRTGADGKQHWRPVAVPCGMVQLPPDTER